MREWEAVANCLQITAPVLFTNSALVLCCRDITAKIIAPVLFTKNALVYVAANTASSM